MKKLSLLAIIIFFIILSCGKDSRLLYPLKYGESWVYVDETGTVINPGPFVSAHRFSEGFSWAVNDETYKNYSLINSEGKVLAVLNDIDTVSEFAEGLSAVKSSGKSLWGYIDTSGNWQIEDQFEEAGKFQGGVAIVVKEKEQHLIRPDGTSIATIISAGIPGQGLIPIFKRDRNISGYQYIDFDGNTIIKGPFDWADTFSKGQARVLLHGKWFFIDKNGNKISREYDEMFDSYSQGLLPVKKRNKWFFIDEKGNQIGKKYDNILKPFTEGRAIVQISSDQKKYYLIEKTGKIVSPAFDGMEAIGEGRVVVMNEKKYGKFTSRLYGYIDLNGNIIVKPQFKQALFFKKGFAQVGTISGYTGIIDKEGQYVVPPVFDYVFYPDTDLFEVEDPGFGMFFVNRKGEVVHPDEKIKEAVQTELQKYEEKTKISIEVSSSSVLADSKDLYSAEKAIDNNPLTSWVEGKEDDGAEEWIKISFSYPIEISGVNVKPGYFDDAFWEKNNRVKEIRLTVFENGNRQVYSHTFADQMTLQTIPVKKTSANAILLEIVSVFPGTEFNDTCIADISLQQADDILYISSLQAGPFKPPAGVSIINEGSRYENYSDKWHFHRNGKVIHELFDGAQTLSIRTYEQGAWRRDGELVFINITYRKSTNPAGKIVEDLNFNRELKFEWSDILSLQHPEIRGSVEHLTGQAR